MQRGYQNNYSLLNREAVYGVQSRLKKARTILAVLNKYYANNTSKLNVLDMGASTGIIDHYLSVHFHKVTGIDIDSHAIEHAKNCYEGSNLNFRVLDAMNVDEKNESFDIIICSHVYEHVPDQNILMNEIFRLLKPKGICYFSAGNRLNIMEPHYNLPFLSILPHFLSDIYLRLLGRGTHYYEKHRTYWGLKRLTKRFLIHDFTQKIIFSPQAYNADYMLPMNSFKLKLARVVSKCFYCLLPGYIWLLEKK